jgi:hypothetical protein
LRNNEIKICNGIVGIEKCEMIQMITIISWGELMDWYTGVHPVFNQAKQRKGLGWAGLGWA